MFKDPIVDEVRKARQAHAAKFKYDLQVIFNDLKEQEIATHGKINSIPHNFNKL